MSDSLHVLLVEDKVAMRELLIEYLMAEGHTFEIAIDGKEGMSKFSRFTFDAVITDRDMPGLRGEKIAAIIKLVAPEQSVIMITGAARLSNSVKKCPPGVDGILSKPLNLPELREVLDATTVPSYS